MDVDERRDRAWQMHNEQGLDYRTIARELGVSPQTVHNDLMRGDDGPRLSRAWQFRDRVDELDEFRPSCAFCLGERERPHDRACPALGPGKVLRLRADFA